VDDEHQRTRAAAVHMAGEPVVPFRRRVEVVFSWLATLVVYARNDDLRNDDLLNSRPRRLGWFGGHLIGTIESRPTFALAFTRLGSVVTLLSYVTHRSAVLLVIGVLWLLALALVEFAVRRRPVETAIFRAAESGGGDYVARAARSLGCMEATVARVGIRLVRRYATAPSHPSACKSRPACYSTPRRIPPSARPRGRRSRRRRAVRSSVRSGSSGDPDGDAPGEAGRGRQHRDVRLDRHLVEVAR
jgi:hypothetical protein